MKQLKIKDIVKLIMILQNENGMSLDEINELPIYLGDDDELNGVHNGWYCELIDSDNDEDGVIELINSNYGTTDLKGKAILIS